MKKSILVMTIFAFLATGASVWAAGGESNINHDCACTSCCGDQSTTHQADVVDPNALTHGDSVKDDTNSALKAVGGSTGGECTRGSGCTTGGDVIK